MENEHVIKKIKIPAIVLYTFGLILVAFGISAMIKTNLGITVITSFPYSLHFITNTLTIGTWIIIIQCIILLIAIVVLKKLTISMVASFVTAYFLGVIVDFFDWLFLPINIESIVLRIVLVVFSSSVIATGAALLVHSEYPPFPDLVFIRDVSKIKKIDIGRFKLYFDIVFFTLTVSVTLIVLHKVIGVGIGTIISVSLVGLIIKKVTKWANKRIVTTYMGNKEKTTSFLEYNLISFIQKTKKT